MYLYVQITRTLYIYACTIRVNVDELGIHLTTCLSVVRDTCGGESVWGHKDETKLSRGRSNVDQ